MIEALLTIFKNSLIITGVFMAAFGVLEFTRQQDVIAVFQNIFKEKYVKTYLAVFGTAMLLQAFFSILGKLIF